MNTKTPFTPKEVNAKLSEIRIADDRTVELQAIAAETDFNKWLLDIFELADSQVDYLESLGAAFSESTGESLANAFRKRHLVTMEKGEIKSRSIKFVRKEETKSTTSVPNEEPVEEEELNFFIS